VYGYGATHPGRWWRQPVSTAEAAAMVDTERLTLLRYDVFTDRPYAGNPLAVAIEPPDLDGAQMQRIAAEMNLSETVFLRSRADGSWSARIFTPATELPFAGHPTVGAAVALADAGLAPGGEVVLHEGVGPVSVTLVDGVATLTTPGPPVPVESADTVAVAAALGLDLAELHPELGPRAWSAGVPFTMVAVRDLDVLGRARVDTARWAEVVAISDAPDLYVMTPLDGVRGERWRARMFGPVVGVVEDPATGSGAAAACGYLAGVAGAGRLEEGWVFEQGVEMGRPSEIRVRPVLRAHELVAVRVGGRAVCVGRGELVVPRP
jgi:trans-2,3-dihydro-3-hydroxyanthranilate isomerase